VKASGVIGSPGYPTDPDVVAARAGEAYDRCYCPEGTARQLGAILGSPDRTQGLHQVQIPFLVIHGEADPLIQISGGEATAAAVPNSVFVTVPGMGHDLPVALYGQIADAIVANAQLATV
jgi:pimeloyl-ACP methyl ester carboxylesterase